ncbi:MAG: bifunctional transcriptional activator/DNA repair enzyme AdaA [Gemmatimonadota bacterium]
MLQSTLPAREEMLRAFSSRDVAYDGVFVTAVLTTGIFCRPTCAARKPAADNVEFFSSSRDALLAGYRPCKRCRPMEASGSPPAWLERLLVQVEADPARRWTDADLRRLGVEPDRVRRWFQKEHRMTFHAYQRARRLGLALGRIQEGSGVTSAAFDHGYESLSGFHEAFRRLAGGSPLESRDSCVITVTRVLTPLGPMIAGATDEALTLLEFTDRRMLQTQVQRLRTRLGAVFVPGGNAILQRVAAELDAYFSGDLREFSIPVRAPGTPFQQRVWERLRRVAYGTTASYGQLARDLGCAGAVRAVARANGDNRIAILIPCHRVIGADGRLTGYGGGLWRKRRLLETEGVQLALE